MADGRPRLGEVFRYDYLWRREFERGEDSGRKARPVCVTIMLSDRDGVTRVLLFPITSQPPGPARVALSVPETEARRTGLRTPAWIIIDDCNIDLWEASFHFADRRPVGRFSYAYFDRIRAAALQHLRGGALKPSPRQ